MPYKPSDVKWEILPLARRVHASLHAALPDAVAQESIDGLRQILCSYFSASDSCDQKTTSIAPMGSAARGGRVFKVRWSVPGRGKSGGLRLAVVAMCPERHIIIAGAWERKTDPSDTDFAEAVADVDDD